MPTVIDALVVELGLDPTKFTEGQKAALDSFRRTQESAVETGKSIEAQSKKTIEFFSNLKKEALGLLAIFLGGRGIKEFADFVTHLDISTGYLSRTMNMSSREVRAWQIAAEEMGGTAEDASAALQGISSAMHTMMITGQVPAFARFTSLFNVDANGVKTMKDAGQVVLDLADRVQHMNPADATAFLNAVLPGINPTMINLMLRGRAVLEDYLNTARKMGPTPHDIEMAERYQRSVKLFDNALLALGQNIFTFVAPALTALFGSLSKLFALWNSENPDRVAAESRNAMISRFGSPRESVEYLFGREAAERLYGPRTAGNAAGAQTWAPGLPAEARGLLRAISPGESGGAYNVLYGGGKFSSYAEHPNVPVPIPGHPGQYSTAAGRYQMLHSTWMEAKNALGLTDFSPASQDKAAWWLAQRDYKARTGRDLLSDLQSGDDATLANVGRVLAKTWTSLPGGAEQSRTTGQFTSSFRAGGPAAAAAAPNVTTRPDKTAPGGDKSSSITTNTHIGELTVNAPNSDADDIAKKFPDALRRVSWAASANYGLTG